MFKKQSEVEYRELWNMLSSRQESLINELAHIENLMLWVEIRSGQEKSNKLTQK